MVDSYRLRWGFALALAGSVLGAVQAGAEEPYQGVEPGSSRVPDHLPGPPGSPLVTWPGFMMLDGGGSMVFVQAGIEPELERKDAPDRFVWLMKGLRLPKGNLRRPLVTHYFDTPVEDVRLEQRKGGVALVLRMKRPVEPIVAVKRSETGYFFVTLSFPPAGT